MRETQLFLGMSLPAILLILVVVFVPIFWLSSLSFFDRANELSLENYERIFQSKLYLKTFIVTFEISVSVTLLCILLGYPLCYWLSQLGPRTAGIMMVFVSAAILDLRSGAHLRLACPVAT